MEKNSADIKLLTVEQRAIRKQLEVHNLATESLSAALIGLCEMTEDYECCTWIHNTRFEIPDYYEIIGKHREEVIILQDRAREVAEEGWDTFKGLTGFGDFLWFKKAGMLILMCLLFLLLLYAAYKHVIFLCSRRHVYGALQKITLLFKRGLWGEKG